MSRCAHSRLNTPAPLTSNKTALMLPIFAAIVACDRWAGTYINARVTPASSSHTPPRGCARRLARAHRLRRQHSLRTTPLTTTRTMSLQVNLSSPDIRTAYEEVLKGSSDYLILTYEKGSNDLKVQTVEQGSLEDALFDFSSGRIQYGFVRVVDPNSQLAKFVLINWCGEGVPESRKGLFASHSATVSQYMKNYHVSINARREDDLDSKAIMKRVTDSSGSKYTAAGQSANTQTGGKIEPVGSSYKPIGAPDIRGMQAGSAKQDRIEPVGSAYKPARDELASLRSGQPAASSAPPSAPRPVAAAKPAPTAGPTPSSVRAPTVGGIVGASTPAPARTPANFSSNKPAVAPAAAAPAKPAEDDRIKPVGTAYEPVKLGKPGKLGANRFPFGGPPQDSAPAAAPAPRAASGGLTWSQRQEKAKKEQAEEEARSKEASSKAAGVGMGAGAVAAGGAGAGLLASRNYEAPPAPPTSEDKAVSQAADQLESTGLDEKAAVAPPSSGAGKRAVAIYEYAAAEDNEISFAEGDTITGIEMVDEGWWSGVAANGQEGLFPSTCESGPSVILPDAVLTPDAQMWSWWMMPSRRRCRKRRPLPLRRRRRRLLPQQPRL